VRAPCTGVDQLQQSIKQKPIPFAMRKAPRARTRLERRWQNIRTDEYWLKQKLKGELAGLIHHDLLLLYFWFIAV